MRGMLGNLAATALATALALALGEVVLRPFVTLPLPRTLPEVRYDPHPIPTVHAPCEPARVHVRRARRDS